ncbi:MAG: hypothetical protein HQL50_13640 [Magnetococcales bacterium]|nr:hypothetical protein [Magnetococcales bacterium]
MLPTIPTPPSLEELEHLDDDSLIQVIEIAEKVHLALTNGLQATRGLEKTLNVNTSTSDPEIPVPTRNLTDQLGTLLMTWDTLLEQARSILAKRGKTSLVGRSPSTSLN